ncbi:MAG: hypothetical protein AAF391_12535, partial [Bacteroidota bacterium]
IEWDRSYKVEDKTIRDLMEDYLDYQPWGDLGIDLGLGMQIDREATDREYMFLPEYIHFGFEKATMQRDSTVVPFISRSSVAYQPPQQEYTTNIPPVTIFVILFFVVGLITHRNLKYGKRSKWVDYILFSLVGFVGWWVAFLWLGTEHLSKWNLNILWALPFHIPLIFFAYKEKYVWFFRHYFKYLALWYSLILLAWPFIPQPIHSSLVPLILILVLRCFYLNYHIKQTHKPKAA